VVVFPEGQVREASFENTEESAQPQIASRTNETPTRRFSGEVIRIVETVSYNNGDSYNSDSYSSADSYNSADASQDPNVLQTAFEEPQSDERDAIARADSGSQTPDRFEASSQARALRPAEASPGPSASPRPTTQVVWVEPSRTDPAPGEYSSRAQESSATGSTTIDSEPVDAAMVEPVTADTAMVETPTAPMHLQASYGYDKTYAWLKGKLERSRLDGTWKLRYIPISGETDRFGGSVVLADSSQLDGYSVGDFIAVEGHLGNHDSNSSGFAPVYQALRIKSLAR
jgi:hypothetical protein